MNLLKGKRKGIKVTLLISMLIFNLVVFIGCIDEGEFITYNPSQGDVYAVKSSMDISMEADNEELFVMNLVLTGETKYTTVNENEILSEVTYKNISGEMSAKGEVQKIDESNPNFSELLNQFKNVVIKLTQDSNGNTVDVQVEGLEGSEDSLGLSSSASSISKQSSILNNVTVFEGSEVEIPLSKIYSEDVINQYGMDKNESIKCKINKITDDTVYGSFKKDSLKVSGIDMDIDLEFEIDKKSGICNNLVATGDMSQDMNGKAYKSVVKMKMTMKKK